MKKFNLVKESCARVMTTARHVSIEDAELIKFADGLIKDNEHCTFKQFDECQFHQKLKGNPQALVDQIFVLDFMNFCFWPSTGLQQSDLANCLKDCIEKNEFAFKPSEILKWDEKYLQTIVLQNKPFLQIKERLRILYELAIQTIENFEGEQTNIIKKSNNSASKLLEILIGTFTNLQDHAIYQGEQVFFQKRAQILVADLWGAFNRKEQGAFKDIYELTTFADQRVPQVLQGFNILKQNLELIKQIQNKENISPGSEQEVEIRAGTVMAVEKLKNQFVSKGIFLNSIEVDWILWQKGEELKEKLMPHHRTLTIFY